MIFLTIGTQEPFDRLIRAVDELVAEGAFDDDVVGQVGNGLRPKHFRSYPIMDKMEFDGYMKESKFVISHAGMGSIITANSLLKPMIVMPRLRKYREHVNDHQLYTACRFEELGVIMTARDKPELKEKSVLMRDFEPVPRHSDIQRLISRIADFLNAESQLVSLSRR
jgi:UDP-N-acetylglucosamine transferase subunit ALG13